MINLFRIATFFYCESKETEASFIYRYLLVRSEDLLDVRAFQLVFGTGQRLLQLFSKHNRQ